MELSGEKGRDQYQTVETRGSGAGQNWEFVLSNELDAREKVASTIRESIYPLTELV